MLVDYRHYQSQTTAGKTILSQNAKEDNTRGVDWPHVDHICRIRNIVAP